MSLRNKIIFSEGRITREEELTFRSKQRAFEDENYIPVIVKRSDEVKRHPDDTLEKAISEGLEQFRRTNFSLFLSAVAAGLILGFTAMLVAIASQYFPTDPLMNRLAIALVYPFGFIVCVMSGTQLFTEHTATAVYPVLDKREKLSNLLRVCCLILLGNLSGTALSSLLLYIAEPVIVAAPGYVYFFEHLTCLSKCRSWVFSPNIAYKMN